MPWDWGISTAKFGNITNGYIHDIFSDASESHIVRCLGAKADDVDCVVDNIIIENVFGNANSLLCIGFQSDASGRNVAEVTKLGRISLNNIHVNTTGAFVDMLGSDVYSLTFKNLMSCVCGTNYFFKQNSDYTLNIDELIIDGWNNDDNYISGEVKRYFTGIIKKLCLRNIELIENNSSAASSYPFITLNGNSSIKEDVLVDNASVYGFNSFINIAKANAVVKIINSCIDAKKSMVICNDAIASLNVKAINNDWENTLYFIKNYVSDSSVLADVCMNEGTSSNIGTVTVTEH